MAKTPTGYLSPRLEGRILDSKGGHGVFAVAPVAAGEILVVWGGEVLDGDAVSRLRNGRVRLVIQVDENHYLLTGHEGPADWVNHSCEPNAGLRGQITLVAMRNIKAGEEICMDYAMCDGSHYDEFECGCGQRRCRRRISGNDWQNPVLQRRYDGYFSPYLANRIASQVRLETMAG